MPPLIYFKISDTMRILQSSSGDATKNMFLYRWSRKETKMTHTLAVNLTKELLKIESTDPGTYESAIETWIRSWLTQLPDILISEEEVLPGRKFREQLLLPLPLSLSATWIPW